MRHNPLTINLELENWDEKLRAFIFIIFIRCRLILKILIRHIIVKLHGKWKILLIERLLLASCFVVDCKKI